MGHELTNKIWKCFSGQEHRDKLDGIITAWLEEKALELKNHFAGCQVEGHTNDLRISEILGLSGSDSGAMANSGKYPD